MLGIDDIVIVLLEWMDADHELCNQNAVAVERDGSVRWRIGKCPDVTGGEHDIYNGLYDHDGELWVTNFNGMKYKVDKNTGEITEKKFVK